MAGVRDRWVCALGLADGCKKGLQRWRNDNEYLKKITSYKKSKKI
jgi:hypothetical protein